MDADAPAERHAATRAAYERALADYETARSGPDRLAEFRAADRVDRARRAYFDARDALGVAPDVGAPRAAPRPILRYRPFASPAVRGEPGAWLRVALNVALPLLLFAGLGIPIAIFAFGETQRGSTFASDTAVGKVGGGGAARTPTLTISAPAEARAASRFLDLRFNADIPLAHASVVVTPDPGVACDATLESPTQGRIRCAGALPGGRDFTARLTGAAVFGGAAATSHEFHTQEQLTRLEGVKWFTEFEDPTRAPLACAAASCRIIQNFTTGQDRLDAYGILSLGRQLNRSRDPGLDPAAIAEVLRRLDPRNLYHYYVYATREEMTRAAAAWLVRSGKPVVAITLGGQHAPLVVGFTGDYGASLVDPATRITGVVVIDPQRGDLDPRTAQHRPDKSRSADFQTGKEIGLTEWYRDEWWLGSPYWFADGNGIPMDRTDGAYQLPHWSGNFVLLADDGDAANPPDRMGRVPLR